MFTRSRLTVPPESYRRLGATPDDLEGLVDHPRDIAGVEVAVLFRRIKDGSIKASLLSLANCANCANCTNSRLASPEQLAS